jgi:hypothetical protein
MRSLKSFKTFLEELEFYEKRDEELSNISERNKRWKRMNESADVGWGEFKANDELYDSYMKLINRGKE